MITALRSRGESVCTVESLTGGLLCAHLTEVPGASEAVRGGIVAYTMDVKRDLVAVDRALLDTHGAVSPEAAEALAHRAREIFGSTWAVSTTGVAGPSAQEGKRVGTVYIAVAGPRSAVVELDLPGDRHRVREQTCAAGLALLHNLME